MKLISAALVKAQKAYGPALKTKNNPHLNSKYADLASCIEAIIDALNDNGIALMQKTLQGESGVTVQTVFIHESGEMIDAGYMNIPAVKQDPQGFGSALTYARRYSLMAACGIAPEDDDGQAASKPVSKKESLTNERFGKAVERIKAGQYTTKALHETFTLTAEQQSALDQALANA